MTSIQVTTLRGATNPLTELPDRLRRTNACGQNVWETNGQMSLRPSLKPCDRSVGHPCSCLVQSSELPLCCRCYRSPPALSCGHFAQQHITVWLCELYGVEWKWAARHLERWLMHVHKLIYHHQTPVLLQRCCLLKVKPLGMTRFSCYVL